MADELKALHETISRDWEEMKSQLKRHDADGADVKQTVETVNAAISKHEEKMADERKAREALELKVARMEQLERAATETKDGPTAEMKAWAKFIRKGEEKMVPEELKSLATDSDTDGGFTVPAPQEAAMVTLLRQVSSVESVATVTTIGSGNALKIPKEGSDIFAAGKVGERDTRSQTANGNFALETIPVHEWYANPFVTQTMLDDTGFDVEAWIASRVANRRAYLNGTYHLSGTGEGEPEGILTNSEISYVPGTDASAIVADGLIDTAFALPAFYARNAQWAWRRATTGKIRKLRTSTTSEFLWAPGINGGTSATVLGYSYNEWEDMPAVAGNAYPVLFGDFKACYHIVNRKGMMLTRDPFSSKPFVEFYFTWRSGGQVVLAEAMRKMKIATS